MRWQGWFLLTILGGCSGGGGSSNLSGMDGGIDGTIVADAPPDTPTPDADLTCRVPAMYPTIAAALADPACPTIYVWPGTYAETLTVTRAVTITGENGRPVIDGTMTVRPITSMADLVLQDLD